MSFSAGFLKFVALDGEIDKFCDFELENVGFDTTSKQLSLAIQNFNHYRNSDRRKALETDNYVDPLNEDKTIEYLKEMGLKTIKETIAKKCNAIKGRYDAEMSGADAAVFASTEDLEEAAGALMGTYVGVNINQFYKLLQIKQDDIYTPHVFEKIKMLFEGKYKNIELYSDKISSDESHQHQSRKNKGWIPKRSNLHKLWHAHHDKASKEEWKNLLVPLGVHSTCIDNWYRGCLILGCNNFLEYSFYNPHMH